MAASLLVETGRRNLRLNGTFGLLYNWDERLKVSAEFLQQKFNYRFSSKTECKRMHQYALGVSYQQDFCYSYLSKGEIVGYLSYAPSKRLKRRIFLDRILSRHIDGSTAYGGEVNFEMIPWKRSSLAFGIDYDGIVFHRRFKERNYVAGFGGSVRFCQNFTDYLSFNVSAEFRRPFNYFETKLNWLPMSSLCCSLFGSYTKGKSKLPNVATAGLELNYAFPLSNDGQCKEDDWGCMVSGWVSTPAVCLPEVLAVAEERDCHYPTSVSIPPFVISVTGFYAINVAPFFMNIDSLPLLFTASGLPEGSSINALSGIISGFNPANGLVYPITVTASKKCASTSQSFTITFL